MSWEIQWLQHLEPGDDQCHFERRWFGFNKLWRNPCSQSFPFLQESSKALPVLSLPCAVSTQGNVICAKKPKKGWCKLNSKTYQFLQCSISILHIFAEAPQKCPWHGAHKHREQQTAPADVCMNSCSWRHFQRQLHCHAFDLFPNQKHVVGLFCLFCLVFYFFFSFFLQSIPQPQMHFIEFLPCVFFSCHEVFETWLARLNIFHSCLYTNLSFFKSYPWLWVWTQDFKHLINLL